MSTTQNGDREAARRKQAEMHREQSASERGLADAEQGTIDVGELGDEDLIEALTDPDIARDDDAFSLQDKLEAEFGRHLALGNISDDEYERMRKRDRGLARLTMMEHAREGRIGSKCRGDIRQVMVSGGETNQSLLSDDDSRQIAAAFEQRSLQRSLSKGGMLVKNLLQAVVETRSRTDSAESQNSSGIMNRLFG